MNKKAIYENVSFAEKGNLASQSKLCQYFYDNKEAVKILPDDLWKRIEAMAHAGFDYANFIMHCRYFDDPAQSKLSYDYIRKAIRHKEVPLAVLRLGITYAHGVGTTENHVLACYFYEMALSMGCQEADTFIDQEFESGKRNIVDAIMKTMGNHAIPSPQKMARYKKWIEKERIKKNYGYLTKIREYLPVFYPDYDEGKAFEDILNNRDTVDADICFSLSTSDNQKEFNLDLLESILQQLFAPFNKNEDFIKSFHEAGNFNLLGDEESELRQCIVNLSSSYDTLCEIYNIDKKEIYDIDFIEMYPYIHAPLLALLRKQAFRRLLSIRDVDREIMDHFLNNLTNDEDLLNICEDTEDHDFQMFLISFVELNLDIDVLECKYQKFFYLYRNSCLDELASHLNNITKKLTDAGIDHHLPMFTPDNIPPIELT